MPFLNNYKTMPRIHYTKLFITELEVAYAFDAACNGWAAL